MDGKRLSLDDPLGRYVSGIPYGDQITIDQLLAMTSGIFDYVDDPDLTAAVLVNPLMSVSLADVVAIIQRNKPLFPPGTSIFYDNSNYYLLGVIAEKASGLPLDHLKAEKITRPLGLDQTSYPTTPAIPAPFSRGYTLEAASIHDYTVLNPAFAFGSGAMISTLSDLKVWVKALATGTLLTPATQALRLKTRVLSQVPQLTTSYGLGIFNWNGFLGHAGAILGYGSMAMYLPARDATIVAVGNLCGLAGNSPPELVGLALAAYLFPEQFPHGI